jgi:hypothetical protein
MQPCTFDLIVVGSLRVEFAKAPALELCLRIDIRERACRKSIIIPSSPQESPVNRTRNCMEISVVGLLQVTPLYFCTLLRCDRELFV